MTPFTVDLMGFTVEGAVMVSTVSPVPAVSWQGNPATPVKWESPA
jgi:hypothetical protein